MSIMKWINFPNCEGFHWFCKIARFFAPQPHILLPVRKNIIEALGAKKMVPILVIIRNAQMLNTVNAFIEKRISLKGSEWLKPRTLTPYKRYA